MNSNVSKDLTREELYERIWSIPTTQLANELGISDVALAKRCKKLNVPKPALGYWAKVAAGKKVKKTPLPPTPNEVFIQAAEKPLPKKLSLPKTIEELNPLATELVRFLKACKPDYKQLVRTNNERTLPEVTITKELIDRTAKSFHTIVNGVETLGIIFRKGQGYNSPYFQKGHDRLYLKIEEILFNQRGARTAWWEWQNNGVASGLLVFSLNSDRYGRQNEKEWKETETSSLEELLSQIVTAIRKHYVEMLKKREQEAIENEKRRVEWERQHREWQAKEAIRIEEERKQKHANALLSTTHVRSEDLLKAAEWWQLYQTSVNFINHCEQLWRTHQENQLTTEQEAWLKWANETAKAMSPFELGYPDPTKDGPFLASDVPFGGPYPSTRDFPCPPSMPKIPPPIQQSDSSYGSTHEPKQQFPFWLKYQGR